MRIRLENDCFSRFRRKNTARARHNPRFDTEGRPKAASAAAAPTVMAWLPEAAERLEKRTIAVP